MSLVAVGTSHKHSPMSLREQLSFSAGQTRKALFLLKEKGLLRGAVILSTCNRVEIYASADNEPEAIEEIMRFMSSYREIDMRELAPYLYIYRGKDAVRHLSLVASGADSLIVGETQILNQVKRSFLMAEEAGFTGALLTDVFNAAINIAGKVHAVTTLSKGKISVGSVAIDFIKERVGPLSGKSVIIVGVGKVTELVLKYLKDENPKVVFISNRSYEKAQRLALDIGAKAVRFDVLKQFLRDADVLITATASPHFVISTEMLRDIFGKAGENTEHRLLIIDLALPRDVDPLAKGIPQIDLFCLEDLDTIIKSNLEKRSKASEKAKTIIKSEIEILWKRFSRSEQEPVPSPQGR